MPCSLSHVVSWSHQLLAEVLCDGDCAIDLTAGNGCDTLMLAQKVGPSGQVLAFDLQTQALEQTRFRLENAQVGVHRSTDSTTALAPGVNLMHGNHVHLRNWQGLTPRAIIANLGYLPGGDKRLVTKPCTTVPALQAGCRLLLPGGRMIVVVYTGHSGGQHEAEAVESFFAGLPEIDFEVLRLAVINRPRAPFLLVAEKLNR